MVLAAAKTVLSMSKQSTRKVQHGNEVKMMKGTALQKQREMDKGSEQQTFCVSLWALKSHWLMIIRQ